MKILYVALSCGPNLGSEDAIGWNLPLEVSRIGHDVTVLTREDKRTEIEEYISKHPEDRYPTYKYVPLSKTAALCKGPLYSLRALIWCRSASKFVKHIASLEHFDVIHQITPVEFRAILDLREGGVRSLKMLGPVGGAEYAPRQLSHYLRDGCLVELSRRFLNAATVFGQSYCRRLSEFHTVMFANCETKDYLNQHGVKLPRTVLRTEIGIKADQLGSSSIERHEGPLRILYVGRLIPRKGVAFLLDACAIAKRDGLSFELRICGSGSQEKQLVAKSVELGLEENVTFLGAIDHGKTDSQYRWADVAAMPSVRETGGAVIAEALSNAKPVIALNSFGFRLVLDETNSYLLDPSSTVEDFAHLLSSIRRKEIASMDFKDVVDSLLWNNKAAWCVGEYEKLLEKRA